MLQITECTRTNLCINCDDERCMHKGQLIADCPKERNRKERNRYEQRRD